MSKTLGLRFAHLGSLGHAYWRGALRVAQRHGPLRGEGMGELGGRLPTEPRVRVFGIVILAPGGQRSASMLQGREQGLAQQLVAQSIIAALNKGILGRLSGSNIVPDDLTSFSKGQGRIRCELSANIADHCPRLAVDIEQRFQFARHPCTRQQGVGDQGQAFAGAVIDDGHNTESPAICQLVRNEIQGLALVWRQRQHHRGPCANGQFPPSTATAMPPYFKLDTE